MRKQYYGYVLALTNGDNMRKQLWLRFGSYKQSQYEKTIMVTFWLLQTESIWENNYCYVLALTNGSIWENNNYDYVSAVLVSYKLRQYEKTTIIITRWLF